MYVYTQSYVLLQIPPSPIKENPPFPHRLPSLPSLPPSAETEGKGK